MREIVWSDDALQDFNSAILYIAKENAPAAMLVADRLEAALRLLTEIPTGHQGRVKGTYEKLVQKTPYIIAYALSARTITVLRVIHGHRDWPADMWPD